MVARIIHGKAELAREKGDFLLSLQTLDEAILAYQKEKDYLGLSEALTSCFLTYKHLFFKSKDTSYQILAKYSIKAAAEISEKYADEPACSLPYYNLAQFYDEFDRNYPLAIDYYKKAIEIMTNNPPEDHKSQLPGLISTMEVHLHAAEYKNGDKSSLERLLKANEKISNHYNKYEKDVWMSGGYMKLAEMLREDDKTKSKVYMQKAKEIIDANKDLTIRKRQWDALSELLNH